VSSEGGFFHREKDGALLIRVKVEPRSSKSEIRGLHGEALKVKLKSPPVEGKANEELLRVLSKGLGIAKSSMEIATGLASKTKTVRVRPVDDSLASRLSTIAFDAQGSPGKTGTERGARKGRAQRR